MIIYKDRAKRRFATAAKILSIQEGKGKAFGRKCTVSLSYEFKGKEKVEKVDFWDSRKNDGLKLYSKVSKLKPGDYILVLIANDGNGISTAIAFAEKQECLSLGEERAFLGQARVVSESPVTIGFECSNPLSRWHAIQTAEHPGNLSGKMVLITGDHPKDTLSKKGTPVTTYQNGKVFVLEEEKKQEPVISIGCYKRHPVTATQLLKMAQASEQEKIRLLSWMTYVADEWEPDKEDQFLQEQKKLVKSLLKQVS